MRRRSAEISVAVPANVALYILNQKRAALTEAEQRYHFRVSITSDDTLIPPNMRLERVRALTPEELGALPPVAAQAPSYIDEEEEEAIEEQTELETVGSLPAEREAAEEGEPLAERPAERETHPASAGDEGRGGRRRRRRRRRRGGEEGRETPSYAPQQEQRAFAEAHDLVAEEIASGEAAPEIGGEQPAEAGAPLGEGDGQGRRRRRRGRRGGRRRRRGAHGEAGEFAAPPMTAPGEEDFHPHDFRAETERGEPGEAPEHPPEETRAEPVPAWAPVAEAPVAEPHPAPAVPTAAEAAPAPPPSAAPAAEAEQAPAGAVNVPQPITISERPAKPRRGWWGRLTQG